MLTVFEARLLKFRRQTRGHVALYPSYAAYRIPCLPAYVVVRKPAQLQALSLPKQSLKRNRFWRRLLEMGASPAQ